MSGVRVRAGGPDDDAGIRALIGRCFPRNPKQDAAMTAWQYWGNPFGPTLTWVAEDDGRIVAHWSAFRVPLRRAGQVVIGAKGADVATDPDYRGQGLARRVVDALVGSARQAGVAALLMHPNPQSWAVLQRAGTPFGRLPVWVRPLDDAWLGTRLRLPRPVAATVRRAVFGARAGEPSSSIDAPPDDLDSLWRATGARLRNGIIRDQAWWSWRYAARPSPQPYRYASCRRRGTLAAAGVAVAREAFGARMLHVLDLLAIDAEAAGAVLGRLTAETDAVAAALVAAPGSPPAGWARSAGFRRLPKQLEPNPLRFVVGTLDGRPVGDWWVAWGDLDHL